MIDSNPDRDSIEFSTEADLFWRCSLELYAKPGVKRACLSLQDKLGIDVNVLFFCVWWPASGKLRLDDSDFEDVLTAAAEWHRQVVLGLRTVRRTLSAESAGTDRPDSSALRKQMLAVELEAEHMEQTIIARVAMDRLSSYASGDARQPARIAEEIGRYIAWTGFQCEPDDVRHLQTIVDQAPRTAGSAGTPDLSAAMPPLDA